MAVWRDSLWPTLKESLRRNLFGDEEIVDEIVVVKSESPPRPNEAQRKRPRIRSEIGTSSSSLPIGSKSRASLQPTVGKKFTQRPAAAIKTETPPSLIPSSEGAELVRRLLESAPLPLPSSTQTAIVGEKTNDPSSSFGEEEAEDEEVEEGEADAEKMFIANLCYQRAMEAYADAGWSLIQADLQATHDCFQVHGLLRPNFIRQSAAQKFGPSAQPPSSSSSSTVSPSPSSSLTSSSVSPFSSSSLKPPQTTFPATPTSSSSTILSSSKKPASVRTSRLKTEPAAASSSSTTSSVSPFSFPSVPSRPSLATFPQPSSATSRPPVKKQRTQSLPLAQPSSARRRVRTQANQTGDQREINQILDRPQFDPNQFQDPLRWEDLLDCVEQKALKHKQDNPAATIGQAVQMAILKCQLPVLFFPS